VNGFGLSEVLDDGSTIGSREQEQWSIFNVQMQWAVPVF
jgi:hypothetical protein